MTNLDKYIAKVRAMWISRFNSAPPDVAVLLSIIEKQREALVYYGHPDHYESRMTMTGPRPPGVLADRGLRAREVEGKIEKMLQQGGHNADPG